MFAQAKDHRFPVYQEVASNNPDATPANDSTFPKVGTSIPGL
jgi:hypothetical protein